MQLRSRVVPGPWAQVRTCDYAQKPPSCTRRITQTHVNGVCHYHQLVTHPCSQTQTFVHVNSKPQPARALPRTSGHISYWMFGRFLFSQPRTESRARAHAPEQDSLPVTSPQAPARHTRVAAPRVTPVRGRPSARSHARTRSQPHTPVTRAPLLPDDVWSWVHADTPTRIQVLHGHTRPVTGTHVWSQHQPHLTWRVLPSQPHTETRTALACAG